MAPDTDRAQKQKVKPMGRRRVLSITIPMKAHELNWMIHAAKLEHLTPREYVVQAINQRLQSQGVDAVLLKERS